MSSTKEIILSQDLVEYVTDYCNVSQKSDGTYRGYCPIHKGEHNDTSFTIYPATNTYYCWSCQSGGDIIHFEMALKNLCYDDAVESLAEHFNLKLDENWKHEKDQGEYYNQLCNECQKNLPMIVDYLHKRGFTDETISKYRLGYDKRHSAWVIPLINQYGRIIGFTSRYFDESKGKYHHSRSFKRSEFWFNLGDALNKVRKNRVLYLVEGHADCMSISQQGYPSVAYLGIKPTKKQIEILKKNFGQYGDLTVVMVIDNDGKAKEHIPTIRDLFKRQWTQGNIRLARVDLLPNGVKDANDMLQHGIDIGSLSTEPLEMSTLKYLVDKCPSRETQYTVAKNFVLTVDNEMIRTDICTYLAQLWGKDYEDVKNFLNVKSDDIQESMKSHADVMKCLESFEVAMKEEKSELGLGKGLDDSLDYMRRKEICLLSAYTGCGKSELAVKSIVHRITKYGQNVVFFSLEMSRDVVISRVICEVLGINMYALEEWLQDKEKHGELYSRLMEDIGKHLIVVDSGIHCVADMTKAINLANEYEFEDGQKTDMVVVDHWSLLDGTTDVALANSESSALLELAKTYNVFVLCLIQMNENSQRLNGTGKWHEPSLVDIKGFGSIKQISSIVLLVWRPYFRNDLSDIERDFVKNITMLKIGKARRCIRNGMYFALEYDSKTTHMKEVPIPDLSKLGE